MVRLPDSLPQRWAAAGVVVTGMAWSLGNLAAHWTAVQAAEVPLVQSAILVAAGGLAAVFAAWFGAGAATWAAIRALGGRTGLMPVLLAVSAAAPPLWLAAPTAALLLAGAGDAGVAVLFLATAVAAGVALFALRLAERLQDLAQLPPGRAGSCLVLAAVFLTSFVYLQI